MKPKRYTGPENQATLTGWTDGRFAYTELAFKKLVKLEDIEQENGIELATLFLALKNGIYGKEDLFGEVTFYPDVKIGLCNRSFSNMKFALFPEGDDGYYVMEQYKTLWALTKEELE